jgi:hypothetical protein
MPKEGALIEGFSALMCGPSQLYSNIKFKVRACITKCLLNLPRNATATFIKEITKIFQSTSNSMSSYNYQGLIKQLCCIDIPQGWKICSANYAEIYFRSIKLKTTSKEIHDFLGVDI